MDATKESIANLVQNTATNSKELYATIAKEVAVAKACTEATPALLRDVPELRIDVAFMLVDLQTCIRASLNTDKGYEKRYHLKNLYAGILEGYKLLYGFGKMRHKTIWYKVGKHIDEAITATPEQSQLFEPLKQNYDAITEQLKSIEANMTSKDDRNLTYHYDDDLLLVYRLTLKTNSEDEAIKKYIPFRDVVTAMLGLTLQIELAYGLMGNTLPPKTGKSDGVSLMIVRKVSEVFGNNPKLPVVLSMAVDKGAEFIDSFAGYKEQVLKAKDVLGSMLKVKTELPEFDMIKELLDVQLLVYFMMTDASCIMRAFINSGSDAECPLFLRRLLISRVSTLTHLIGYGGDEENSMWARIMDVIPSTNEELKAEAMVIKNELRQLRQKNDGDTRALFVHLINNHSFESNIPDMVGALEDLTILSELGAAKGIITVCGKISKFMPKVMGALSDQAKKKRMESNKRYKKQMDEFRALTYHPNCPKVLGDSIRQQMDEIEMLLLN